MIHDSVPWRAELLRVADRLERKATQKRWTEQSGFIVERDSMMSAYAIRRLMEAGKVSRATSSVTVPALRYAATETGLDMLNRHKIDEYYDLSAPHKTQLGLREYCNQFIHSFVWGISVGEHGLFDGVFSSSEYVYRERLYCISVTSMVDVCRRIGQEKIRGMKVRIDESGARHYTGLTREEMDSDRLNRGEDSRT